MKAKYIEKTEPELKEYDLDNKDDKNMYDDMLDEVHGEFMGYNASYILKNVDPVAYRTGFNDYTDGLSERWECPECGEEYEDKDDARGCCQEDLWECSECGKQFDNEDEAENCCTEEND